MTDQADTLARTLASYRQTPGMIAALLVSRDGFVIAADAEPGFDVDAFAAQAGGVLSHVAGLGGELGEHIAKYVSVEFEGVTMVLAPFGDELLLALLGRPEALVCQYRINSTVA
jgi:predicted regulator of Ras-like GTPase activity (Roadblock/LC7/MglB family)